MAASSVRDNGTVSFTGGTLVNTSGTLSAINSGVVNISNGAVVSGGTLKTTSGGQITLASNSILDGVSNGAITIFQASNITEADNQTTYFSGTIANNGTITVGTDSDFRLLGANNGTFNGTGTITLNAGNSRIFADQSQDVLTFGAGQTVQGQGNIGLNQTVIRNAGVITANVNGGTLFLDPTDGEGNFINTGTLRAENGGTLQLYAGNYTNNGATISALAGSTVAVVNGAAVAGGTVSTVADGKVQFYNGTLIDGSTHGAISLVGNVSIADNQTGYAQGTVNDNTLTIGTDADLRIAGTNNTLTLANNGTTTLVAGNSRLFGDNNTATLVNTSGNTIQGQGNIGLNQTNIQNAGLITANVNGGTLTLDPNDAQGSFINTGTLRAENGGTLQLLYGYYTNSGANITALTGSAVTVLNSATIAGGTVSTAGTGTVQFYNGTLIDGATHGAISLTGNVSIADNQTGYAVGTVNDNTLTIGTDADLRIAVLGTNNNTLTLANNGTTTLVAGNSRLFGDNNTATLVNTLGNTIQGQGNIGLNQTNIQNAGLITANVNGGTLTLDPNDAQGSFINTGTLRAENGGTLQLLYGAYDNGAGTILAAAGSAVTVNNGAIIEGGHVNTAGTGTVTFNSSSVLDGSTRGLLSLNGNVAIADNQTVYGLGIINDSTLQVGNDADFRIAGTNSLTLQNGTTTLVAGNSRIFGDVGSDVLTNASSNTIQGQGQIGANQAYIVNNGLITSNVSGGTMVIDPSDGTSVNAGLINTGVIRAENGGNLQLLFGYYNNAGGTISALDTSNVAITNNAQIQGGTLSTAGSGTITLSNGATLDGTAHGALTNTGSVIIATNQTDYMTGSIVNNGTITQQADSDLRVAGTSNLTLSGTGTYTLTAGNARIFGDSGNDILTNGAGHTINGYGQIGANQLQVTNAGSINANVAGQTITLNTSSAVINQSTGVLQASNSGTLYIDKAVTGTGTIRTDSGGTVQLNQAAQTGQLINNANLSIGTNNVTVSADYSNANFGSGDSFNKHAGITGTGQILAASATQAITGTNVTNGTTASPTLTIGNVRVGGTTYNYQVADGGSSTALRGALQTTSNGGNITDSRLSGNGVTAGNYGPVAAGSNSGNLGVTFTVANAGLLAPLSGQAVHIANNFDNVAEQTLGITLASGAAAYNVAVGSATPTPISFGNVRVNGTDSQALAVHNGAVPGAYSEDLNASFGPSSGSASGSGTATHVVAGTTNSSALTASLSTATAGAISGAVTVNYATAGTVNGVSNGLGTLAVGSQTIALSGNVYNTATGSTTPTPVVIANQRVNGTNSQALTVTNALANGQSAAYTEALNASISSSGAATGSGGPLTNIAAGASNTGGLTVGVNTMTSGAKTGNVTIAYQSDGTGSNGHSGLAAISAGSQSIAVNGNVYQAAAGTLLTPAFNFGVFQVGQTAGTSQTLSIQNSATGAAGYVEDLNASFGAITGQGANKVTATGSLTGLAAGATNSNALTVGVNTSSAGTVNASVAVNYVSAGAVNGVSNGLGTLAVGSSSYGVSGTIQGTATVVNQAAPVINNSPIAIGNVRINSTSPTGLVSVTNQVNGTMQAALNASISGNAPVTASGSFNQLAPGATNNTSLAVGIDTSSAGSKNGTATIAFVSDSTNQGCTSNCQMQLASQDVNVTGAVYRLANPTVTTTSVTVAGRVGTAGPTTAIGITNTSPDVYTEGLTATRGATSTGFTSSGGITNLVAGGSSNAIGVALNTTTAGTFSGTQALNFVSTGTGTDNASDLALAGQSVTLNGKVYTPAAAQLNTTSVNFGIVHVNDTVTAQGVSVTNSGATSALNDTLVSSALGATGQFTATGNLGAAGLAAQQTNTTGLKVGLNTTTAGTYSGSATFSAASHDSDLSDAALSNLAVSLIGTVNNYASDTFSKSNGAGTLTQNGTIFTLDYGTVMQNSGTKTTSLVASNNATGPADLLNGMFQFLDPADFGETGFGSFTNLAAGSSDGPLMFSFSSATIGSFMDTIVLHGIGTNGSGYSGAIGDIELVIRGTVNGAGVITPPNTNVPEPDSLLLLGLGLPLLFLRRGRKQRVQPALQH